MQVNCLELNILQFYKKSFDLSHQDDRLEN